MYKLLIKHYIKGIARNQKFNTHLIIKLITIFSILYLCIALILLGLNFNILIHELGPSSDPVKMFNSFLVYFFPIDLLMRYFLTKNKKVIFNAYLVTPLKRINLIIFYLVFSLFNFFNFSFLLFIIPFAFVNILPLYGHISVSLYLCSILLYLILISYLVLLIKSLVHFSPYFVILPFIGVFLIFSLKFYFQFPLENISSTFFLSLVKSYASVPLILFFSDLLLFRINISLVKRIIYEINPENKASKSFIFNLHGKLLPKYLNKYAVLEFRLITRNRRLQVVLLMSVFFIFLFYYIFLIKQVDFCFSFVICILINGIFGYMFGQYMFSWEGSYFDFISVSNFEFFKYLKTKYIIYSICSIFIFIILLSLAFQEQIDFHVVISSLLFNTGIGYFIVFYAATNNKEKIELNNSIMFNTKGYNISQCIALSLVLLIPFLALSLLNSFLSKSISLLIIDIISISSLLSHRKWLRNILQQLQNRKYLNLEGYRK